MALSPMPGSENRVPKDERRTSSPRPERVVETAQPVDEDALAQARREDLDAQWRDAGRFE